MIEDSILLMVKVAIYIATLGLLTGLSILGLAALDDITKNKR
ncbi:MAG: hypothetical protein ACRDB0_04530 [Paraclostridium sp.]